MIQVNMHEAKSRLSELAEKALNGEEVVIAKAGKPICNLVPYNPHKKKRVLGGYEGKIAIADDFDDTPKDVVDSFYGISDE